MNMLEVEKNMSYILRHAAVLMGYEMDAVGYMRTVDLIDELNKTLKGVTMQDIVDIVMASKKKRFEFDKGKKFIRTVQGHSIESVSPHYEEISDDITEAYHGTTSEAFKDISNCGYVSSMSRNYIHLSRDIDTALKVGSRYAKEFGNIILLKLDVKALKASGVKVFMSSNNVILVKNPIPINFFTCIGVEEI